MPLPKKLAGAAAAAPVQVAVNFGALEDYSAGFGLPDGKYLFSDFSTLMWQPTKQDGSTTGNKGLYVRVTAEPPEGAKSEEEKKQQHYSMGSKAHESYGPNPETGKGLVAVAGGKGQKLNDSTNWHMLLNSLYDCGMPPGFFTNDFSVLDGIIVTVLNIPEPESRKKMGNQTGEVEQERKNRTVPVVSEV